MNKKIYKILSLSLGILLILFIVAAIALITWVRTGPRSLDSYTDEIEQALTPPGSAYTAKVGSALLRWDGLKHPIDILVKDVSFFSKEGHLFAKFPEISLGFDLTSLMAGDTKLKSLAIINPVISLYQTADGDITFGTGTGEEKPISLRQLMGTPSDSNASVEPTLNFDSLVIKNANLSIGNSKRGVIFSAPQVQFRFTRTSKGAKGNIDLGMQYENKNSLFAGEFELNKHSKEVSGKFAFSEISPHLLSKVFQVPGEINALQVPFSGLVSFNAGFDGAVDYIDYNIQSGAGKVELPGVFDKPLAIKQLKTKGSIVDGLTTLNLDNLSLEFEGPTLRAAGIVSKVDGGFYADITAIGEKMPVDDLKHYWPLSLAPVTRDWVTTRITGGNVPTSHIRLLFQPGYAAYAFPPKDALDAAVQVEGASIEYLPGHPKVTETKGIARFDGRVMDVRVENGKSGNGTLVKKASIIIPDLPALDTQMLVDLDLFAPASDIANFMSKPDIGLADRLNVKKDEITGTAEGNIKLDFLAFTEVPRPAGTSTFDDVKYDVSATLTDVKQKQFMKRYDVEDYDGTIKLTNKGIMLDGNVKTEGQQIALKYTENYEPGAAFIDEYIIKSTLPAAFLKKYGYLGIDGIEGPLKVDATVTGTKSGSKTKASIDATNATVEIATIGFSKPAAVPLKASLDISSAGNPKQTTIVMDAEGEKIRAKGTLLLDATETLIKADFENATYGTTDAAIVYQVTSDGFRLNAKGKQLNIEPFTSGGKEKDDYRLSVLPAMDIAFSLDRLWLTATNSLEKVEGTVKCGVTFCTSADIKAQMADKWPFTFVIANKNGKRTLTVNAGNAGEALKRLNIHEDIRGGSFSLEGTFDDSKPERPLKGRLIMNDYTLMKAPVLAKLLTVASLTGFLDTLAGNGIAFKKLSAPFTLSKDVIKLKEAKAYGPAIGLTADGTINLNGVVLDIDGTVVPSYTLNSFFGKIPLFGEMLTGGGGSGVFAANYSMKGSHKDPKVMVNPLSILTPGFLRNVFDIFDSPKDDDGEEKSSKPTKVYNKKGSAK